MTRYTHRAYARPQRGLTLTEILVSSSIGLLVVLGLSKLYSNAVATTADQRVRTETLAQAQAILQTMGNDFRSIGNGVPFDQANFQIGEDTLSDPTVSEPIVFATSTSTAIAFRLNETGEVMLLSENFDPTVQTQFRITDTSVVQANDPIYISNHVVGEDDGLFARVSAVDHLNRQVTLDAGSIIRSPGATFNMGSTFEVVPIVTYANTSSGITRDSGYGAVSVGANSSFTIQYMDGSGTELALPLTAVSVVNSLRFLRVTVTTSHANKLSTGNTYSVSATNDFAIRNLNILY